MADIPIIADPYRRAGYVQARALSKFTTVDPIQRPKTSQQDFRLSTRTSGEITDQVVLKSGATEVPYANGRVWLLRLSDGRKTWEGWSDAGGYYTATGLELGVEYVAVAIDPLRNFKTVGAGPVTAT